MTDENEMPDSENFESPIEPDDNPNEYDIEGADQVVAEKGPEWMTPMDVHILRLLALGEDGLILTPAVIAENIERSRAGVSRRLNTLQASGYVEKIERGKYKISETGEKFLDVI